MICVICGKEFKDKYMKDNIVRTCSTSCYNKLYYRENKERRRLYFKELHKLKYKPHPRTLKYKTAEERYQAKLDYSKKHYRENIEYYKNKAKSYYERDKNNSNINLEKKLKHREAMRKYYYKKRKETLLNE